MKLSRERVIIASRKITVVLKLGFIAANIAVIFALLAIGILMFAGDAVKASFLAAFDVTANNGTIISVAPQSLLSMFAFMLIDTMLISAVIFIIHAVFDDIKKGSTPFSLRNTVRIKKISIIVIILSLVGSYSDALVDYYTIGELKWKADVSGIIMGAIIYCISIIFRYGCDLQRESDETL